MKVLIIVTSHALLGTTGKPTGYYLPEVSHPYFELMEAGIEVDIASPKGGEAPVDQDSLSMEDKYNQKMWKTPEHRNKLKNTIKLSDVDSKKYAGILFAGGHGTMWDFKDNKDVQKVIRDVYETNRGIVAAVCHGPAALVDVKLSNGKYLVDGKKVAGFSNAEEEAVKLTKVMPFLLETELKKNGGIYSKAGLWQNHVVVDQRIITGQNPASAKKVGTELSKALKALK